MRKEACNFKLENQVFSPDGVLSLLRVPIKMRTMNPFYMHSNTGQACSQSIHECVCRYAVWFSRDFFLRLTRLRLQQYRTSIISLIKPQTKHFLRFPMNYSAYKFPSLFDEVISESNLVQLFAAAIELKPPN